jgi:hypothetical protein
MQKPHRSSALRRTAVASVLAATVACTASSAPPPEPVATTSSALSAITGLFSTGVDATGTPLAIGATDPHYVLSSNDPAFPGPNAVTVTPNGVWTGNTATSKWISIRASTQGANNGIYTYTTTFTLAGVDPTTAALSGSWAADDSVSLMLNGTQVAQRAASAYGSAAAFTVPAGSPFASGLNTLAFVTVNSGNGPTGLQIETLAGTVTGCTADAQCTTSQFCNTQTNGCVAKLANGTGVPTLSGHAPPLTGACSVAVGAAVCVSGVCDTADDECGYADGDGSCTGADAGTVCRSGACSVSGVCEPAGGCEVDADCPGTQWCDETTSTCEDKVANGTALPTDAKHTNPTLDGTCTPAAGTVVCISGVCDAADNECGYADGDGPCTNVDGVTVCRSGACSLSGVCEPVGGCESDGDCTPTQWCDVSLATCEAELPNGTALPSDAKHVSPVLDGTCTPTVAALVCQSKVCDSTDGECGYANGDGPCTSANGATVCRSMACSINGTCEPQGGCNVNGDCKDPAQPDCDSNTHTCKAPPSPDAGAEGGSDGGSGTDAGTDASTADAGKTDGGPSSDGGSPSNDGSATEDASSGGDSGSSPSADSGAADATSTAGGYLDGGGLSCAAGVGHSTGGVPRGAKMALIALALAGCVARRRRRRPAA